ncbi:MAG: rod shape-determining protein MreD [Chloroflexota bacterium]
MGRYISLPLLLIAVILQSTVIPEIRIAGGGPDLILMMVLSWTMLAGLEEGIIWAIVGGVLQDLVTSAPTGTTALALVVVVFLSDLVLGPVSRNNIIFPPIIIAAGTAIFQLVLAILLTVLGHTVSISYTLSTITVPTLLFNVVLILPIFRIMGIIFRMSRPRRVTL